MEPITTAILASIASQGIKSALGGIFGGGTQDQVMVGQQPNLTGGNSNPFGGGGFPGVTGFTTPMNKQIQQQPSASQGVLPGLGMMGISAGAKPAWDFLSSMGKGGGGGGTAGFALNPTSDFLSSLYGGS